MDNWLDETLYPDTQKGKVSLDVWAWEFVRRNASFRSDFETLIRPVWQELCAAADANGYYDERKHEAAIEAWLAMPKRAIKISLADDEHTGTIVRSLAPKDFSSLEIWKRWSIATNEANVPLVGRPESRSEFSERIKAYIAPTKFKGINRVFIFCHSGLASNNLIIPLEKSEINNIAWVKLDLTRAIESQIDAIAIWAREIQYKLVSSNSIPMHRVKKPRTDRFSMYLRILDATDAGIAFKELANVFFPKTSNRYPDLLGNKKVENALTAARKLRDRDWRILLKL